MFRFAQLDIFVSKDKFDITFGFDMIFAIKFSCDSTYRVVSRHIECETHIDRHRRISRRPFGRYFKNSSITGYITSGLLIGRFMIRFDISTVACLLVPDWVMLAISWSDAISSSLPSCKNCT